MAEHTGCVWAPRTKIWHRVSLKTLTKKKRKQYIFELPSERAELLLQKALEALVGEAVAFPQLF